MASRIDIKANKTRNEVLHWGEYEEDKGHRLLMILNVNLVNMRK